MSTQVAKRPPTTQHKKDKQQSRQTGKRHFTEETSPAGKEGNGEFGPSQPQACGAPKPATGTNWNPLRPARGACGGAALTAAWSAPGLRLSAKKGGVCPAQRRGGGLGSHRGQKGRLGGPLGQTEGWRSQGEEQDRTAVASSQGWLEPGAGWTKVTGDEKEGKLQRQVLRRAPETPSSTGALGRRDQKGKVTLNRCPELQRTGNVPGPLSPPKGNGKNSKDVQQGRLGASGEEAELEEGTRSCPVGCGPGAVAGREQDPQAGGGREAQSGREG